MSSIVSMESLFSKLSSPSHPASRLLRQRGVFFLLNSQAAKRQVGSSSSGGAGAGEQGPLLQPQQQAPLLAPAVSAGLSTAPEPRRRRPEAGVAAGEEELGIRIRTETVPGGIKHVFLI